MDAIMFLKICKPLVGYRFYCMALFDSETHATSYDNIRIYHECEGRIEKSVPRITIWHHEACRVMKNDDPYWRIFLSYPNTINGFFFLLTTVLFIH